jgi:hypothetical protein
MRNPPLRRGSLMLGYLDSNQEQMIGIWVESPTRNWGGIPRISAVFMDLLYALARTSTGPFWSHGGVFGVFLVTADETGRVHDVPF